MAPCGWSDVPRTIGASGPSTREADPERRGALARVAGRVRSALPIIEYGTCSGVRVPRPVEPRRLFDRLRPSRDTPEHLPFEGALASTQRRATRPDDAVAIVGGGYGITTVAAARAGASVTVFEPAADRLAAIRRTLGLNDVDRDSVTLRRAVVGELNPHEAAEKGLDGDGVPTVHPVDLPSCDVLELDCEGAELPILRALDPASLPRVIAVEIHPLKLDGATGAVLDRLRDLGYSIERRLTHDGESLDAAAFDRLLAGETPDIGGAAHQSFPPVAVAER